MADRLEWRVMVSAAKRGAEAAGYRLTRVPGRGLSNVWSLEKGGKTRITAIRTTQNRWLAFVPLASGSKWKTLDEVELVVIAAVDSKEDPQKVEIYILPASEVRKHYDAAYKTRTAAGHVISDDFGMWVALDPDQRGTAASAGSGIIKQHKPVAVYAIKELMSRAGEDDQEEASSTDPIERQGGQAETIADVMASARARLAQIAGVRVEAIKLDLKVEY